MSDIPVPPAAEIEAEEKNLDAQRIALVDQLARVTQKYLAAHGTWRILHVTDNYGSQSRAVNEFTPCSCAICQEALQLVERPSEPND